MSKFTRFVLLISATITLVLSQNIYAKDDFSNKDLKGSYSYTLNGTTIDYFGPGTGGIPGSAVGLFVADGEGNITSGQQTVNVGGVVFTESFTCTYNINPDGTGAASCDITSNPPAEMPPHVQEFAIVLISKRKANFLGTSPSSVSLGVAERQ